MSKLRILSGAQIRQAVTMTDIIDSMETAFIELSAGRAKMPVRAHLEVDDPRGTALFMPSYLQPVSMLGIKTATLFEDNYKKNIPYIQGIVTLFDGETGSPKAVLDGRTITALRTGAASGLATRLLAREDSSVCTVFGAGMQGRTQLEAVCAVRDIKKIWCCNRSVENAKIFAREMEERLGVEVKVAAAVSRAVNEADIICCATGSQTPVFVAADLSPGVHINAVGSYKPHVQEVPVEMVRRAKLYVDHVQSALEETGDLIIPINDGVITPEHIIGELGELVIGRIAGRGSREEITFFKSVGVAVQDLAAAAMIVDKAEKQGLGTEVEL